MNNVGNFYMEMIKYEVLQIVCHPKIAVNLLHDISTEIDQWSLMTDSGDYPKLFTGFTQPYLM